MGYTPGQWVHRSFLTPQGFGQLADPSGNVAPTIVCRHNGTVDNAVNVGTQHNATGDWTAVFQIPATYAPGDDVELIITFSFSGSPVGLILNIGPLESAARVVTITNRTVTVTD